MSLSVSPQWPSAGRDLRRSLLQPADSTVRPEQTVRLRLRRYIHTLRAASQPMFQCFWKRRVGFSDFSVFWVSSCGLLRFDNPVHSGEQQHLGFCFIWGDYWSQMKCWLIVLSVNKSQMAAVGSEVSPFLIAEIGKLGKPNSWLLLKYDNISLQINSRRLCLGCFCSTKGQEIWLRVVMERCT